MNRTARRYERVATAAVAAVFAGVWFMNFALGKPPEFKSQYVMSAIALAILATPWMIATRLLVRAWWRGNAANLSATDGPAVLLRAAVATLPDDRREWGAAMETELAHVTGGSARWWFAGGCARAAIFPPRSSRVPLLKAGLIAIAAIAIAAPALRYVFPAMHIFTTAFIIFVGILAMVRTARARRGQRIVAASIGTITGIAGVAACIGATVYFLLKNPEAAKHFSPGMSIFLAAALAVFLWISVTPPRSLTTSRLAATYGVRAAFALAFGFAVTSRLTVNTSGGPFIWIIPAPFVIFFIASALAAAKTRSFGAGAQTALWAALIGTLVIFAISLPEAMRRYAIDGRILGDGESGYPIGVNLADAIWVLVIIPMLGLPFGVIGAAVGRRLRGKALS